MPSRTPCRNLRVYSSSDRAVGLSVHNKLVPTLALEEPEYLHFGGHSLEPFKPLLQLPPQSFFGMVFPASFTSHPGTRASL